MEITFKLYAGLRHYLPKAAEKHAIKLTIAEDETAFSILDRFNVPKESVHMVLLNGIYMQPEERTLPRFNNGDTLAVWPPVAGG